MAFELDVKIRQKGVRREGCLRQGKQGEALNKSGWWGKSRGAFSRQLNWLSVLLHGDRSGMGGL